MSLIEAIANVLVGFGLAVLTQIAVFPLFGLRASLGDNLAIGGMFTAVSLARSYALRRPFEAIRIRSVGRPRERDQRRILVRRAEMHLFTFS